MKGFLIYIKSVIDFIILIIFKLLNPIRTNTIENNLLFINTGQIGDLVVSSTLLENDKLFNHYNKVYFLIDEKFKELFSDYSGIIELLFVNLDLYKYNYIYRFNFNKKLYKQNIEIVYNLTSVRPTWNDTLSLGIGAKKKYCYPNRWKTHKKAFAKYTNNLYSNFIASNLFNEYERIDYLIEKFNNHYENSSFRKNRIFKSIKDINEHSITIAPFSSDGNRDIGIKKINKIILSFPNFLIQIICSEKQLQKLDRLSKQDNVRIIAGTKKLNELFSVLNNSKIFIGIDSGLTHIALKTKTKVIALIGQGNYGRYLPKPNDNKTIYLFDRCEYVGCEWYCVKEKVFCIENITAKKIIYEIENALKNHENP